MIFYSSVVYGLSVCNVLYCG